jgi:serine/threonine protein kinase
MYGDHVSENNKPIQPKALVKRGYTVAERIGQGGYGMILTARSARHHSRMAIKVIERCSSDSDLQKAIESEKLFADMFDHPYINVYHEIIETSKR